ncbi:MAG: aconitase X catalytic domain-containing protein [Anaerolineales bacterium]
MTLRLTEYDRDLLAGTRGAAPQLAMRILVRMAEVYEAEEMMDITAAHIDSALYMGEATLAFAERLADLGGQVVVPTTLNVSGVDEAHWMDWPVPAEWAERATRQMRAYSAMGCAPTWTCAPYQVGAAPQFGQQIAWGESNAIAFANSVLGARTERYPDLLDICAALTGRVPAVGLHLDKNRAGQLVVRLTDVPRRLQDSDAFWPVLGHLLGELAGPLIPVLVGLEARPTEDQLKALGAAAASSGSVALFHIVGVTPEAPTLEAACKGSVPAQEIEIDASRLATAWRELSTAAGSALDMVVLGSPHFSVHEFRSLAPLVRGAVRHKDVTFVVTTSRAVAALAEKDGALEALRMFGGVLTVDTCILTTPMMPGSVRTLMTNSAKYAYYAPGLLNVQVVFGSLDDCVRSAIEGRVVRDESLWNG